MTKINTLFFGVLLALLSLLTIGVVAQSGTTTSDVATASDQTSSQNDGTTSGPNSLDSTSTDPPSTTPDTTTDQSTSTTTDSSPTTTTTTLPVTTTDPPPTTTTPPSPTSTAEPSPTTTQPPQTTPNTPAPYTTTNSVNQTPSSAVSQSSGTSLMIDPASSSVPSSAILSMPSSIIASVSGSAVSSALPIPTVFAVCSASNATCSAGQYCNAANQTCAAVLPDGSACSSSDMCASGVCNNSVCGQSSGSSSTGTIVGIALGSTAGVGLAAGLFLCVRRRRQRVNRMRGFTPSMALNGHLNNKHLGSFRKMPNTDRHRSDYSFTSEQAALESLSSMSMTMSPIARQSAVYYKDNQLISLSGTSSPFDDGDTYQNLSVRSSQPVLMPPTPLAMQKSGARSSKFDFLQNAFANRKTISEKQPIQPGENQRIWPTPAHSVASSVRTSGITLPDVPDARWEALVSQPPSRAGFAGSDRTGNGSNRMSTTTFGSGHHHVGIGDDEESVADPNYSPSLSQASARIVLPGDEVVAIHQQQRSSYNPFRTYQAPKPPRDAWSKEDEEAMYF